MRLPRKGILIRLLIYLPLLGFFGWQALDRYLERHATENENEKRQKAMQELLDKHSQPITMPDGSVQRVPVLTPEQAKELWGIETPEPTKGGAAAQNPGKASPAAPGEDPSGQAAPDGAATVDAPQPGPREGGQPVEPLAPDSAAPDQTADR